MYHTLVYYVSGPIFRTFFRLKVRGKENIPPEGEALIFAANHKSYLDPVLVGYCMYPRRLNYMAKAELWKVPVLAGLITGLDAFPVQRGGFDRKALVTALQVLREGKNLLIFPEGTRIRRPGLGKPLPGVTAIASKTGVKIVPVGIRGADRVLPKGAKFPRFPKIEVGFGKAIDPSDYKGDPEGLTGAVMGEIGRLIGAEPVCEPKEEACAE